MMRLGASCKTCRLVFDCTDCRATISSLIKCWRGPHFCGKVIIERSIPSKAGQDRAKITLSVAFCLAAGDNTLSKSADIVEKTSLWLRRCVRSGLRVRSDILSGQFTSGDCTPAGDDDKQSMHASTSCARQGSSGSPRERGRKILSDPCETREPGLDAGADRIGVTDRDAGMVNDCCSVTRKGEKSSLSIDISWARVAGAWCADCGHLILPKVGRGFFQPCSTELYVNAVSERLVPTLRSMFHAQLRPNAGGSIPPLAMHHLPFWRKGNLLLFSWGSIV